MTTDRIKGQLVFECDNCGETSQDNNNFIEAWNELKDDGWKTRKFGSDWNHYCPKCAPHIDKTPNLDEITNKLMGK